MGAGVVLVGSDVDVVGDGMVSGICWAACSFIGLGSWVGVFNSECTYTERNRIEMHSLTVRPNHRSLPFGNQRCFGAIKRRIIVTAEDPDAEKSPSAIPEVENEDAILQQKNLPSNVIARLRDSVFGIDTLFVTSVENYEADGVLFKGNLRGDPAIAYAKLKARLVEEIGDQYQLFLLENQEEQPVAVVLPIKAVQPPPSPIPDPLLSFIFGITTIATTLNVNDAQLFNAAFLVAKFDPQQLAVAAPGTVAFLLSLLAHELGHYVAASKRNIALAPPLFIPAGLGLLGSFGGITRIRGTVPDRQTLAEISLAGPLAGSAVAAVVMVAGLVLTKLGIGGVEVETGSFRDSLLAGILAQSIFGDKLFDTVAVNCSPLFVAGWAGLIVNAINVIPAGELDGGRLFLSLFGRRSASRMSTLSFLVLGIGGFNSSLALFWLLLVLSLQRGPVVPCENELTPIKKEGVRNLAIAALLLPALVLLPYPFAAVPVDPNLLSY